MPDDKNRDAERRERLKAKRRDERTKRRAALAADPRMQELKQKAKERRRAAYEQAKARHKMLGQQKKLLREQSQHADRAARDAALAKKIRPATEGE